MGKGEAMGSEEQSTQVRADLGSLEQFYAVRRAKCP